MEGRFYKKIYGYKEFYRSIVLTIKSRKYFRLNHRKKLISPQFKERIMLAVTEVNGCEVCSYAHTKIALEEGLKTEEIKLILSGDIEKVPEDELVGLLFAQDYTDRRGRTTRKAWKRLVDEYGKEKAMVILAYIRMMNMGNIYGMAINALVDRFKGKPSGKTSLFYELSIIFLILFYIPLASIQVIYDKISKNNLCLICNRKNR